MAFEDIPQTEALRDSRPKIEEVLRGENPAARTAFRLTIGGEDYTGEVISLSVSSEAGEDVAGGEAGQRGGIALALEAEIAGYLPSGLGGEEVALDVVVGGVAVPRFRGRALRPQNGRGSVARLIANTAGYWLSRIRLGAVRGYENGYSFTDEEPWVLALSMLHLCPYTGEVDVERVTTPRLSRAADEAFTAMDYASDVLEAVCEEADMSFRDTFSGGCRGRRNVRDHERASEVWTFRVGEDLDAEDFAFDEATEEYSEVVCYRQDADGNIEILARAEVPDSNAPAGCSFEIEVSAAGDPYAEAERRLYDALGDLGRPRGSGTATLPFIHPLIEDGDVVRIVQPLYRFRDETIVREIAAEVVAQTINLPEKTHELELAGQVVREGPEAEPVRHEEVAPPLPGPAPSHGGYPDALIHRSCEEIDMFLSWLGGARGYIGEFGVPSNLGSQRARFYPDQENWRVLGEHWFDRLSGADVVVNHHCAKETPYAIPAGGDYASTYVTPGDGVHRVVDRPGYQAVLMEARAPLPMTGMNFPGGQVVSTQGGELKDGGEFHVANPGTHGVQYWYPTLGENPVSPSTGMNSFEYLASRGMRWVRIGFRWERIQPTLLAPLEQAELGRLVQCVANAGAAGLEVVLCLFNQGGYNFAPSPDGPGYRPLGSAELTQQHFEDIWRRLSEVFASESAVIAYDLMNEPQQERTLSGAAWEAMCQGVVNAIRARGDQKAIMVPALGFIGRANEVAQRHPNGPWIQGGGDIRYTAHHYFAGTGSKYFDAYAEYVRQAEELGY